jgi:hypothetical protein
LNEQVLLCDLGYSLVKDMKVWIALKKAKAGKLKSLTNIHPQVKQTVTFNLEKLEGDELLLNATAITASDESNDKDNNKIDQITLQQSSDVDLIGWVFKFIQRFLFEKFKVFFSYRRKSLNQQIYLDTDLKVQKIIHQFEVSGLAKAVN